jgi:hypothetical protein
MAHGTPAEKDAPAYLRRVSVVERVMPLARCRQYLFKVLAVRKRGRAAARRMVL